MKGEVRALRVGLHFGDDTTTAVFLRELTFDRRGIKPILGFHDVMSIAGAAARPLDFCLRLQQAAGGGVFGRAVGAGAVC